MYLLKATKRAISSGEIQRQLGLKHYLPYGKWCTNYATDGLRDARYNLHGDVKIDGEFFSTETPEDPKDYPLKWGHGSQRRTAILVMSEKEAFSIHRHKGKILPPLP